jgi:hypothetical protein
VLTACTEDSTQDRLNAAGFRTCRIELQETDEAAVLVSGEVAADAAAGTLKATAKAIGAVAIFAEGGCAVSAVLSGLPAVLYAPLRSADEITDETPLSIHIPGAWHGGLEALYARALFSTDNLTAAIAAIPQPNLATRPDSD